MNKFKAVPMRRHHLDRVVELLQEVSVFEPDPNTFDDIWDRFSTQANLFPLVVLSSERVLGFGVLLVEQKIRGGKMGHIEDVVSDPEFRGLGIGRLVIRHLLKIASTEGCYKVALHCQQHNVGFYEKYGFKPSGSSMQKIF